LLTHVVKRSVNSLSMLLGTVIVPHVYVLAAV
jgi:hypothetical protein